MKVSLYTAFILLILLGCKAEQSSTSNSWCTEVDLSMYDGLRQIETTRSWFSVFEVGDSVYAIAEPYNYEEVISFLILGNEKALLFDTGMGIDSISLVVKELTDLPIMVFNSHTHHDHIGGNHEFDHIVALDTEFTKHWAENGWPHDKVKNEVSPEAFCHHKRPSLDTASYAIKPFEVTTFVKDGDVIDLGNRSLSIMSIPGHTPDAVAIWDRDQRYLWTGDTFYEATIWLFYEGTDLLAYEKSIAKLAALSDSLVSVFPAHNRPIVQPIRLKELATAFSEIKSGSASEIHKSDADVTFGDPNNEVRFEFEHFSFLIRNEYLSVFR